MKGCTLNGVARFNEEDLRIGVDVLNPCLWLLSKITKQKAAKSCNVIQVRENISSAWFYRVLGFMGLGLREGTDHEGSG